MVQRLPGRELDRATEQVEGLLAAALHEFHQTVGVHAPAMAGRIVDRLLQNLLGLAEIAALRVALRQFAGLVGRQALASG